VRVCVRVCVCVCVCVCAFVCTSEIPRQSLQDTYIHAK